MGRLILIPWHIGNHRDVTLRAIDEIRRLRIFLAEDPEHTRSSFARDLSVDCSGKRFLETEPELLPEILTALKDEDVGVIASGGSPCFLDPGAWLVRELRGRGIPIVPLAGASVLTTLLSASGVEWHGRGVVATVAFFVREAPQRRALLAETGRRGEPIILFLKAADFQECLRALAREIGERPVTAYLDMTKGGGAEYPHADEVKTLTARAWLEGRDEISWDRVGDVALLIHPAGEP